MCVCVSASSMLLRSVVSFLNCVLRLLYVSLSRLSCMVWSRVLALPVHSAMVTALSEVFVVEYREGLAGVEDFRNF